MTIEQGCDTTTVLRLDEEQANQLAAQFKALGHPIRLQIMDLLSRYGGLVCVCEVEAHFSLTQPTISHHLKVLRNAGLITVEQSGPRALYHLTPDGTGALRRLLDDWTP